MRSTRSTMASSRSTTPISRGASSSIRVMVSLNRTRVASRPLVELLRSVSVSLEVPEHGIDLLHRDVGVERSLGQRLDPFAPGAGRARPSPCQPWSQCATATALPRRLRRAATPWPRVRPPPPRARRRPPRRRLRRHRVRLFRAGDHQPHLARALHCGQCQRDPPWRRLGGVGDADHQACRLPHRGGVREQRVDVALRRPCRAVHVEIRCGCAIVGVGGQHLLVGERRGVDVVAELAVAGRHRVHVGSRDVDVVQQRLAGLLVVAVVVGRGDVAFVAPEQVHLGPVDRLAVFADVLEQFDAGSAAGEHDVCDPRASMAAVIASPAGRPPRPPARRRRRTSRSTVHSTPPCRCPGGPRE